MNPNIKEGIENFRKFIRRANKLSNEQLSFMISKKIEEDPIYYTSVGIDISGYIQFIRDCGKLTDDQMDNHFKKEVEVNKDPVWIEIFEDYAKKKSIKDMSILAKDFKSDPRLFAKKIGADQDMRNYIRKVA